MPQARHLRAIATWLVVLPGLVFTAARLAGWDTFYPAIQLMAYAQYVAVAAVIPPAAALLLRQWIAAGVAGIVLAALVITIVPRMTADGTPPKEGATIRVMSANLLAGGADPVALTALVKDNNVDVLALQEFTPEFELALHDAGIDSLLPHHVTNPVAGVRGSAIYARLPLTDAGFQVNPGGFGQTRAVLADGSRSVTIESVHTRAPDVEAQSANWRGSFAVQTKADRADKNGPLHILAGDFNATLDHSPMRALIATGYRDAADVLGEGVTPTWPYDGRRLPPVTLDHVLVDIRIGISAYEVFRLPGSDHRPILAELTIP
jgi:endonuclease/exonuclease/phosphatase (EEP) superfamily protein YafD